MTGDTVLLLQCAIETILIGRVGVREVERAIGRQIGDHGHPVVDGQIGAHLDDVIGASRAGEH